MPRMSRGFVRGVGVCALSVLVAWLGAVGAVADEGVITDQPYVEVYGFKGAHAQGLDGSGVTIAVLDGWVDTSVPELAGADIESVEKCSVQKDLDDTSHATAVTSMLVSRDYGWVPKAKILSYPLRFEETKPDECRWWNWDAIHDALSKKVDIISIQVTGDDLIDHENFLAVLRAAELGVPVVWGAGNSGTAQVTTGMRTNGAIAVGAHTIDQRTVDWGTFGEGMTLTALGEGFVTREPDESGALTRITRDRSGTSFATPMVTGALALGMQKWPGASGNQLIRAMIETAVPCTADGSWSDKCGYGVMDLSAFSKHANPTTLEDSNPLLEKSTRDVEANRQTWRDYLDGLVEQRELQYDTSYVYRGSYVPVEDLEARVAYHGQFGSSPRYMKRVAEAEESAGLAQKGQ